MVASGPHRLFAKPKIRPIYTRVGTCILEQVGGAADALLALEDRLAIEQCLRDLGITDPRYEKDRIQAGKDKLLKDCYAWILDDPDFRCWRDSGDSKLLWIKGDPGKGKAMIMIALAE